MLDALISGTTDPQVHAIWPAAGCRAKIPARREALECRFEAHHALVIGAILAHLDFLDEQINRLSVAIENQLGRNRGGRRRARRHDYRGRRPHRQGADR